MTQTQPTLPDPQTAYDTVLQDVHARIFFNKCASAGFAPRSQEEAQAMLDTAGRLRQLNAVAREKAGSDSPYLQMNRALTETMAKQGFDHAALPHEEVEHSYKEAAAFFANDPNLYNSVLALKVDEAEQTAKALGLRTA